MNQALPEQEQVKLALREVAVARERLQVAHDILSAIDRSAVAPAEPPAARVEARRADLGEAPQDLLDLAHAIIKRLLPGQLTRRANQAGASPRDWLYRVQTISIAPRGIDEPVATILVMLAAVKFGLRHQLLLQTETRLGLPHKTPIPNLDLFIETFLSEMLEADRSDARFNNWLKRTVEHHYPGFRKSKRLDLPEGEYILVPKDIGSLGQHADADPATLTSPVDPASGVVIPPGSDWRITLRFAQILDSADFPAFDGKRHSGIDVYRWNAFQAPVYAMRAGVVIDSVYLPKGFGNTVVIEHGDGTCLRYTHLDNRQVSAGDPIVRGQPIGTVGKGAKDIYPAHLHLDMPRSSAFARARTYYDTAAEVAERFIDPLSQMSAGI